MGWRTIYIEEANTARLYLDNIKIERDEGDLLLPLRDIHTIVFDNYRLNITAALLSKCSEFNINIVICSKEHKPSSVLLPISGNYRGAEILKKQIQWSDEMKGKIHRFIIRNKIRNQCGLLCFFNIEPETIRTIDRYDSKTIF